MGSCGHEADAEWRLGAQLAQLEEGRLIACMFLMMVLRVGWQSENFTYVFCGGMSGGLSAEVGQFHVIERWWCSALGIVWRCHMRPLQEGGRLSDGMMTVWCYSIGGVLLACFVQSRSVSPLRGRLL